MSRVRWGGPDRFRRLVPVAVAALLISPGLAACTANNTDVAGADPRTMTVTATDTECLLSTVIAPSGTLRFSVTNTGSTVSEFFLLGADGLRIAGDVENIGPALTRDLVIVTPPGRYFTACKPGMAGDGIRSEFVVTDSGQTVGPAGDDKQLVDQANLNYATYVRDQADQLLTATQAFAAAYKAGNGALARSLYAPARLHWERIEPVAQSFGDLVPKMDLREAGLVPAQKWTGWHRIEKDLWRARATNYTKMALGERAFYADDLLRNIQTLDDKTRRVSFTANQIANGARALLREVARSMLTGEEEYWSRTDLWDLQGNLDGARVAFEGLQPLLQKRNPALAGELATRFAAVQTLLDRQHSGSDYTLYDKLSDADIKSMSDAVTALAEPWSKLAAAVV